MDSKLKRLLYGDYAERAMILLDADSTLISSILEMVEKCKKKKYTYDQLEELKALNYAYDNAIQDLKSETIPFTEKVNILKTDGVNFIHKLLVPLRKQRRRKACPVPGCKSIALLQLHNHLKHVHHFNDEERKHWQTVARLNKLGINTIAKESQSFQDEARRGTVRE